MVHPGIRRYDMPRVFRAGTNPHLATSLRLTLPLRNLWAVEARAQVQGLSPGLRYRVSGQNFVAQGGSGLPALDLWQVGLGLRKRELWPISPRLALDAAGHVAYGWAPRAYATAEGITGTPDNGLGARWQAHSHHRSTLLLGAELLLRYELSERHFVLLNAGYQWGLRRLGEVQSVQTSYPDTHSGLRTDGRFVVSMRGSAALVQLGYGWQWGAGPAATVRPGTPRYSLPPTPNPDAEPAEDPDEN
ncbi:hypothetical protein GCM10027175_03220 [Hymenobacter latericoloratus]